jgi:vanillate O-demethylase monooxygenase subunit
MLTRDDLKAQKSRADKVAAGIAGIHTPLIKNCWYVAARSDEVSRNLKARRILGSSVVLFRSTSGTAIALQDRCAHRSFPLSEGKLDGDIITCRYHGLQYDTSGQCVKIPSQDRAPGKIGLRRYPVIERPPFIWVWMGNPDKADPKLAPELEWLDNPGWEIAIGYLKIDGSYVHMHENLLDLSHLSFLHETSFGTPEYAAAPYDIRITDDDIQVWRHVNCQLPALYAKPLGWEGARAIRHSGSQLVSPGLHVNTGIFENLDLPPEGQTPQSTVKVGQIITPESNTSMHYYYVLARNFALGDRGVSDFMLKGFTTAFSEDLSALQKITEMHRQEDPSFLYEIDIPSDRAGIEMKRRFKRMAEAEAGETQS